MYATQRDRSILPSNIDTCASFARDPLRSTDHEKQEGSLGISSPTEQLDSAQSRSATINPRLQPVRKANQRHDQERIAIGYTNKLIFCFPRKDPEKYFKSGDILSRNLPILFWFLNADTYRN
jgi:hypothetical protein